MAGALRFLPGAEESRLACKIRHFLLYNVGSWCHSDRRPPNARQSIFPRIAESRDRMKESFRGVRLKFHSSSGTAMVSVHLTHLKNRFIHLDTNSHLFSETFYRVLKAP